MLQVNVNVAEVKERFASGTTVTHIWPILDAHVQCKKEHDNKVYWEEYDKIVAANKAAWPPEFW